MERGGERGRGTGTEIYVFALISASVCLTEFPTYDALPDVLRLFHDIYRNKVI